VTGGRLIPPTSVRGVARHTAAAMSRSSACSRWQPGSHTVFAQARKRVASKPPEPPLNAFFWVHTFRFSQCESLRSHSDLLNEWSSANRALRRGIGQFRADPTRRMPGGTNLCTECGRYTLRADYICANNSMTSTETLANTGHHPSEMGHGISRFDCNVTTLVLNCGPCQRRRFRANQQREGADRQPRELLPLRRSPQSIQ